MSIENLIKTVGRDVDIIKNGKTKATTKAKINDNNTIDFLPNINVRNGDIIKTIDTEDEYTVLKVNPIKNGRGKISHIVVNVK